MKKILTLLLALTMLLACVPGMANETAAPKYVFMFIGDGMGNPQVLTPMRHSWKRRTDCITSCSMRRRKITG